MTKEEALQQLKEIKEKAEKDRIQVYPDDSLSGCIYTGYALKKDNILKKNKSRESICQRWIDK